jgi:hypothetical protein
MDTMDEPSPLRGEQTLYFKGYKPCCSDEELANIEVMKRWTAALDKINGAIQEDQDTFYKAVDLQSDTLEQLSSGMLRQLGRDTNTAKLTNQLTGQVTGPVNQTLGNFEQALDAFGDKMYRGTQEMGAQLAEITPIAGVRFRPGDSPEVNLRRIVDEMEGLTDGKSPFKLKAGKVGFAGSSRNYFEVEAVQDPDGWLSLLFSMGDVQARLQVKVSAGGLVMLWADNPDLVLLRGALALLETIPKKPSNAAKELVKYVVENARPGGTPAWIDRYETYLTTEGITFKGRGIRPFAMRGKGVSPIGRGLSVAKDQNKSNMAQLQVHIGSIRAGNRNPRLIKQAYNLIAKLLQGKGITKSQANVMERIIEEALLS